ncbi:MULTISPECIES: LemA family protein [Myroides]|uniref:LemA family protein n=1 Tax=Myroides odoratimimus CIP 101113 TaxID=883154 RepID=A0AAV3EXX9_9FLAO|nr:MULTISPECIES: LemA family protein [Myroides]AJA67926.1 hypothetical protein MYRA21_0738 [Myroides sp. A21]APA91250.1 LemA family protein [Myroides sp. ZB35]EHO04868.1 hypothetical protein HMPREF9715_03465 [Myroides odoratimimus CIP 101113]EKB02408.1 hypothetical protein HMPREF9711_03193 [Myroides odoratimimus CCUG 3837]MDM1327997.1 LemA family protein [Myroides odoratimimus]
MKKALPIIIVLVVLIGGFFMYSMSVRNKALAFDQEVNTSWADVQGAYQRRNDLIGNLVNTVKGAADFEKSTLEAVVNARAKATSINIDPSNVTPEQFQEFQQAQSGVSSALGRLLVTVEKYPDLKTNQNFLKLQDELASTENQIFTQRSRFNQTVKAYNTYIGGEPQTYFLGKYQPRAHFQAEAGAEKAPEVKF